MCRANFYKRKVESLKNCSPSVWWKEIKKLGSMSNPDAQDRNILNSLHHLEGTTEMSPGERANHINRTFLSPLEKFEPLSCDDRSMLASLWLHPGPSGHKKQRQNAILKFSLVYMVSEET